MYKKLLISAIILVISIFSFSICFANNGLQDAANGVRNVVGGAEKLFTHFIRTYNPTTVVSYCDKSKFTGKTYLNLGFKFLR